MVNRYNSQKLDDQGNKMYKPYDSKKTKSNDQRKW